MTTNAVPAGWDKVEGGGDAAAELAKLRAENAALKAQKATSGTLRLAVGAKGGVSVYNLGRFPVTLYREQWERLLEPAQVDSILRFLDENAAALKVKA